MAKSEIRRIVTRHDGDGKGVVWFDGLPENQREPDEFVTSTLIWATQESPAAYLVDEDAGALIMGTPPPPGGTRFGVIDLRPGRPLHPQHRTDTVDYVVCLSGEVDMEMDDTTIHMKTGDVMVQLGTNHVWINRSDTVVRLAFVLVDGYPKRDGSVAGHQEAPKK
jgi:mannose-6-phosphate isomerase-like protein (cupin superfamily)